MGREQIEIVANNEVSNTVLSYLSVQVMIAVAQILAIWVVLLVTR